MTFTHLDQVLAEVAPLGKLFVDAGYRLFLVGGIVRDQWLDESLDASSDIDLTTNALPAEIKAIVAPFAEDLWTQGEKFGTIGLRQGGRDYEITTHRAESYVSDSRKPQVSFGDDIDVDLSRRDFTVNAMAIELPEGDLVDPYSGAHDLSAGLLRTPLSAEISFSDDPLRMLRAARFATKFGLAPADELLSSAAELHERIRIVAIERIGVETRRLLGLAQAQIGLVFLQNAGLLAEVLAYGEPARIDEISPRLTDAIDVASSLPPSWHQRLAAIGVIVFGSAAEVHAMCNRLKLSRDDERRITKTADAALQIVAMADTQPPRLRRWIDGCINQADAIELAAAIGDAETAAKVKHFASALAELAANEDASQVVFLDGDSIMELLNQSPGPAIGQAHRFLKDDYFEHGPRSIAHQTELLKSWWADQKPNS